MMLLAQSLSFDWQLAAVFFAVLGALVYLVIQGRRKKAKGCGSESSSCGCVKSKKEDRVHSSSLPEQDSSDD